MKSVCFYFNIHQPFRLNRYRFFDIGNNHYYFDDFSNDEIITRLAENSYIPMMDTLLEMIKASEGKFRCAISISGTAIEQFQQYVPEVMDRLRQLAATGRVEFLSGTYSHSLASLEDVEEFMREVKSHDDLIEREFNLKTGTFANTELIYDDDIANVIASMGFKSCLTVGAKHVLGWKSPNYVYKSISAPDLKLLLNNDKLSTDIAENFNRQDWDEYPLTADKYIDWIAALPEGEKVVNLFLSMDVFGSFLPASTGIFHFLKALPRFAEERGIEFAMPSEVVAHTEAVDFLSVPYPISDVDEARDVSAWKGNELQNEALDKLYSVAERVALCDDRRLKKDWQYLQSSDHFYYMSTKNMADGASHASFSPYDSPFAAFTNYMNVLADFLVRVQEQYPESIDNEELNSLLLTIRNQASEINSLKKELKSLRTNIAEAEKEPALPVPAQDSTLEKKLRGRKSPEATNGEQPKKRPGRKPSGKKETDENKPKKKPGRKPKAKTE